MGVLAAVEVAVAVLAQLVENTIFVSLAASNGVICSSRL